MNPVRTVTGLISLPVRAVGAAAAAGIRTTSRVAGWAVEHAHGKAHAPSTPTEQVPDPAPVPTPPATRAPAKKTPKKKVPASQVPLKSEPTPSMPAGVDAIDAALDASDPAPRKR